MELKLLSMADENEIMAIIEDAFAAPPWCDDWRDREVFHKYVTDIAGAPNSLTLGLYDGGELEGDFLYGMVTNTSSVGGFKIFPPSQISLNDGVFEVVLIRQPRSLADFQETLLALARQSTGASGRVEAFHTSRLTITAQDPIPWTLDGEYGGAPETAKIENLHKALTLVWGK